MDGCARWRSSHLRREKVFLTLSSWLQMPASEALKNIENYWGGQAGCLEETCLMALVISRNTATGGVLAASWSRHFSYWKEFYTRLPSYHFNFTWNPRFECIWHWVMFMINTQYVQGLTGKLIWTAEWGTTGAQERCLFSNMSFIWIHSVLRFTQYSLFKPSANPYYSYNHFSCELTLILLVTDTAHM